MIADCMCMTEIVELLELTTFFQIKVIWLKHSRDGKIRRL